jgi:hypothetical protein
LQGFAPIKVKRCKCQKNIVFSSFALMQKKQKIKASVAFGELASSVLGDPLMPRRLTK